MPLQEIFSDCGLTINRFEIVHGGDINCTYCLNTVSKKYFLKVNNAWLYPAMFDKEGAGLTALSANVSLQVPSVIKSGIVEQAQYLLLEWLERGIPRPSFWENFGAGLAAMHKRPQPGFGWKNDNFIGSLVQKNEYRQEWYLFYAECRIMPLVKTLFDKGLFSKQDICTAESFCKKIERLFPSEPASLLHGDLWSGNYMVAETGHAAIFDPAVYCGHREMDIGMSKLFGGFENDFYAAYNEVYPMEKGWQQRLSVSQLYPLLVHATFFGGHYLKSAREIMEKW